MAHHHDNSERSLMTTIVTYHQCNGNHNCNEFGISDNYVDNLMCNTCGCHRDNHRKEETTIVIALPFNDHLRSEIAKASTLLNARHETESENAVTIQIGPQRNNMDVVNQLQRQFSDHLNSIHLEGYVGEQFTQLQKMKDESNPVFVLEVFSLFFQDSKEQLNDLANAMPIQIIDYKEIDSHVQRLKGSSASIGAKRLNAVCADFRNYCEENNRDECLKCLQQLEHEYNMTRKNVDILFRLEQKILAAGGQVPMKF